MSIGRTRAIALIGLDGVPIDIEADIASGLPRFVLVGLPDRSLAESADRVRSAVVNSGLSMPSQRVTVNLSPAGLPKTGTGFDLGIAVAALVASGQIPPGVADACVHIGELALDGRLRPVPGILPAVLAARRAGSDVVIVPVGNLDEAQLVDGIRVVGLASLRDVAIWHGAPVERFDVTPVPANYPKLEDPTVGDLADVVGNSVAVEALITAAAGGHHLSMVGPPGAGKTMLANRLVGLLPDLSDEAAVEVACVRSVGGAHAITMLPRRPPLEAPHHTASTTALVGGGSGVVRPGAIARAAHGILFLDEAPEFSATTLDALRQPLESGKITIHRAALSATYPARFQLVLAANPCPCGLWGVKDAKCECPSASRRRYTAKLSGPLRDRIDIHFSVPRVSRMIPGEGEDLVTTAQARRLVVQARSAMLERWKSTGFDFNAVVPGAILRSPRFRLPAIASAPVDRAIARAGITARGYDRTLRLAWTLCDLEGANSPTVEHVGRALMLRRGNNE